MASREEYAIADLLAAIAVLQAQVAWLLSGVPVAAAANFSNPDASGLAACVW